MSVGRVGILVKKTTIGKRIFPKMEDFFKESYFQQLPNELLITILCYVETFDLINFCEAYACDWFFNERKVVKHINLCRQYGLRDIKHLSKNLACEHVTTLNINYLYWIPLKDLRRVLTKMVNLRSLFAIDTELDLAMEDILIYNAIRIKKLAITVKIAQIGLETLNYIDTLYINVIKPSLFLRGLFPGLRKLWVDLREEPFNNYGHYVWNSPNLTKVFYKVEFKMLQNYTHLGLFRYFNTSRYRQPSAECWEKFLPCQFRSSIPTHIPAWQTLIELHAQHPCGIKFARELYLHHACLTDINFDELNFNHGRDSCTSRCCQASKKILELPNSRFLKKLCVPSCFLQCQLCEKERVVQSEPQGFKRKRVGLVNSDCAHKDQHFLGNFSDLEVLEIFACDQTPHTTAVQVFPLIGDMKMLTSLTVEVPPFIDGSFLINVLNNCKCLEVLKVTSLRQNETLNYNICKAIPQGSSLKDFRYDNCHVPIDRLIEAICVIDTPKLERVMLICDTIDKFSAKPLKTMLDLNLKLIFLYIVIESGTQKIMKMARESLKFYKKQHPAKLLFIENRNVFTNGGYPIPDFHYQEIVRFESRVSLPTVSEHFETF